MRRRAPDILAQRPMRLRGSIAGGPPEPGTPRPLPASAIDPVATSNSGRRIRIQQHLGDHHPRCIGRVVDRRDDPPHDGCVERFRQIHTVPQVADVVPPSGNLKRNVECPQAPTVQRAASDRGAWGDGTSSDDQVLGLTLRLAYNCRTVSAEAQTWLADRTGPLSVRGPGPPAAISALHPQPPAEAV